MLIIKIFVINPGSTSTKLAVFSGKNLVWEINIEHSSQQIEKFKRIIDQLEWRKDEILKELGKAGFKLKDFKAVVARGGLLDPIPGGTYHIDKEMVKDLRQGKNVEHASNLAGIIAYDLGQEYGIPAYTVDPVAVDEFKPVARLSGLPGLPRRCQSHALNLKAIARKTASELNLKLEECNLIGIHLGGGISVAAIEKGKIIDVNNANQGGPYSPERVGTLPTYDLADYIYREQPEENSFKKRLNGKGGLMAYLGTSDAREVEERIKAGNRKAELAYHGMIYQIGKEIGAMAAVLEGDVQAIFITGGIANSKYVVEGVKEMIDFIAPVKIYPGAEEMNHLAAGALRVLRGKEKARIYTEERGKLSGSQF